jgi:hypothetical protein
MLGVRTPRQRARSLGARLLTFLQVGVRRTEILDGRLNASRHSLWEFPY